MTNEQSFTTLLTPAETANLLHRPVTTLARWRCERSHLPYVTLGRRVLYRLSDIRAFIERNVHEAIQ
ncbi:helix-turn-helix domain-containing protein [Bifidobacterium longum]|uniref:helix-turn-helix domain-containing protein n=1 Tax=Bifidobacterium longum TaxID=216816 RepID=UPI00103F0019|nr:helix-turn-helix domain-containing protein [Bifidobacterium longum]